MYDAVAHARGEVHAVPTVTCVLPHALAVAGHVKTLPVTPERTRPELDLLLALGPVVIAIRGYGVSEVGHVYTRAQELCQQVGDLAQRFVALHGLWSHHLVRAELETARQVGEKCLRLAQLQQDTDLLVEAHVALGVARFWRGEVAVARGHLEQARVLGWPQRPRSRALLYGQDPLVAGLSYGALALWSLGYPDLALERSRDALTLAHELAHPHSLAFALYFAAQVHVLRREGHAAQQRAQAAILLANEHGFQTWKAAGPIVLGWAQAEQGQGEEGIAQMCQGLDLRRAIGAKVGVPQELALLAETYGKVGQAEKGLLLLAKARALVGDTQEHWWKAELYRLQGELGLQSGSKVQSLASSSHNSYSVEAEECFSQARALARRQQAKSLELRAAMSLSRLWQRQGKKEEARTLLSEIYGWFTEGFDTADLKEAKVLLQELS
jgi:predicted ATPase